ncbi:MAG TPA: O-antigen ligase family protein [Iamia sp.]|nr:O-antigen ligase family protein [Iamia sp.]
MLVARPTALERSRRSSVSGGLPARLLTLALILLPVQVDTPGLTRVAPSDLIIVVLIVVSFGRMRLRQQTWSGWHTALVVLFCASALYAALVQGLATTYGIGNKVVGLFMLLATFVVFTSTLDHADAVERALRTFVKAVVVECGALLALYLAGLVSGSGKPPFSYGGRFSGTLIDPNAWGGLLVVAFTLHLATRSSSRPLLSGRWALATVAVLPVAIVATGSRSAWIGMGIAYLVIIVREPGRALRSVVLTTIPIVACLTALGVSLSSLNAGSVDRTFSITQRIVILDQGLADFARDPVFGAGVGTFYSRHGVIVHNTPVWFLADFGLVGLVVFLGLCAWVLWRAAVVAPTAREWNRSGLVRGLVLSHIAMAGLSIGIEAFYQRHWWLVMGAIAALASPSTGWSDVDDDAPADPARTLPAAVRWAR